MAGDQASTGDIVKSVIKVLFAGLIWAAIICYSDEFQRMEQKKDGWVFAGVSQQDGLITLFSLLVLICVLGNAACYCDSLIFMICFLVFYLILFVANAILVHKENYIVPIIMGGLAGLFGIGYTITLCNCGNGGNAAGGK